MRIGGFVKQSLIDWDGVLSAVIFTKGCNFRCGYCHNPGLVIPRLMDACADLLENDILNYLNKRAGWIEGVVITGGEPTIQSDLIPFMKRLKDIGYKIKIDTNGTNPAILTEIIDKDLVDYVAMDIKSILSMKEYSKITPSISDRQMENIRRSVELIRNSGIKFHFRTTLISDIHTAEIRDSLKELFRNDEFILQQFKPNIKDGVVADYNMQRAFVESYV